MVPESWQQATLDGICTKITKGTTPPKSEIVIDSDIPFLRVNNLRKGGAKGVTGELIYVSSAAHEKLLARSIAFPGDTLMNIVGPPLGKVTFLTDEYPEYNLNQAVLIYRPDEQQIVPEFLFIFICSFNAQQWLEARSKKTSGQQNLTIQLGKELPISLPPLPEQRKIVDILSTWDQAIEKTEALLRNARTQKRALMQQLLTGKRRFPAFEGQPWKEVPLGDMGETISGGTPDSTVVEYWNGDIAWATPTDITKLTSRFIHGTSRRITAQGLKKSSAKMVDAGAILICTRATIGEMAIATGPICTNQGFKNLVLSDDFDSDFIFYLLQFFKKDLIRYACGSTFLELSKKDFDKRSFNVPSLAEQRMIGEALNDAEAQIDEHAQSITKLRTEKKALMQQLLTGKRRVVA